MVRSALTVLLLVSVASRADSAVLPRARPAAPRPPVIRSSADPVPSFSLFLDPDEHVATKEFAFVYISASDSTPAPGTPPGWFHLIYQRSGGPQSAETMFGHAWSVDLVNWTVDTLAFAIDTTGWNASHVWSPSIVHHDSKYYMFYTGVDAHGDQRIGYTSTAALDTTAIVWDPVRTMVWEASNTTWAVPDPWLYNGITQFRDPYVMEDPDDPGRLLMFYAAHDSLDFKANRGGLAVGVARSAPGTVNSWEDLGYYPSTMHRARPVGELEGPHVFPVQGTSTGWRLMYSNSGTPLGESGQSTIRFNMIAPGASLTDTAPESWGASMVLKQYLNGDTTVFGWSGSEELRAAGEDYLAGFTAWGPNFSGIAIAKMHWAGDDFSLETPLVSVSNEHDSPARGVRMSLADYSPRASRVTFVLEAPLDLAVRLDVFDAMGRRSSSLLDGRLAKGRSTVTWDLSTRDGESVPSGVYFARLSFAGGSRAVRMPLVR